MTLFQAQTIAAVLRPDGIPDDTSLIVEIQPKGEKAPLFWIHSLGGAGGGFFYYRKLAELLGPDQPSYGIRSPDEPFTDVEAMAAYYIRHLRAFQPRGPYLLGGYCFGGNVAYEMARQLTEQGEQVSLLALIESALPGQKKSWELWHPSLLRKFLKNLRCWLSNLGRLPLKVWQERIRQKWQTLGNKSRSSCGICRSRATDLTAVMDLNYPKHYVRFAEAHRKGLRTCQPKPYAGRITLFRAREQPLSLYDSALGWRRVAKGGISVNIVPGTRETILGEPTVQVLANELRICLLESQIPATDTGIEFLSLAESASELASNQREAPCDTTENIGEQSGRTRLPATCSP